MIEKLPTFLIIGANKAGTTSLYSYLRQHPDVFLPSIKEPMFFSAKPRLAGDLAKASLARPVATTTLEEYAALFQESRLDQARGEASTAYLANPQCSVKIRDLIPQVKLIAILRNPIERAFSNYLMYWGNEIETRTFEQCVDDEVAGRCDTIPQGRWYLRLGLYAPAIQGFQDVFGRDALLIVSYDEFQRCPTEVYRLVLEHIRVDTSFTPNMTIRLNAATDHIRAQPRPLLTAGTAARLREYFYADIRQLASLVEFDPETWLDPVTVEDDNHN